MLAQQNWKLHLLAQKFDRILTLRNNSHRHGRVYKRTQYVISNNVASVCTRLNINKKEVKQINNEKYKNVEAFA